MLRNEVSSSDPGIVRSPAGLLVLVTLVLATIATPGLGTSFTPISDHDLVAQTALVVQGTVLSEAPALDSGIPATDYTLLVAEVLKGEIAGTTVTVRTPGGSGIGDRGLTVFGAPQFESEQEVILFLREIGNGIFAVRHLMLGAFHVVGPPNEQIVQRGFESAVVHGDDRHGRAEAGRRVRDADRFAAWLRDHAHGQRRAPDYFVEPSAREIASRRRHYTLVRDKGQRVRWCDFESEDLRWRQHALGVAKPDFRNSLRPWREEPTTNVNMFSVVVSHSPLGGGDPDGNNKVVLKDPNDVVEGSYSCATGGVVATTFLWWDRTRTCDHNGREHYAIFEADIVGNDGSECYFDRGPATRAEVFAHEVGHALGLGHSCGDKRSPDCSTSAERDDAIMRAVLHDDGRGARLGSDDVAGLRALYGPPGPGDNKPAPRAGLPAPTKLRAVFAEPNRIRLRWKDNSDAEHEYRLQRHAGDGNFRLAGKFPADTNKIDVEGLESGVTYTFRVRARGGAGASEYSKELTVTTP